MSRLIGGTHFLVLSADGAKRELFFSRRFDDAFSRTDPHTRLSPIFPLDSARVPTFTGDSRSFLLLLGPIYPGLLPLQELPSVFLTLGLLNVVVYSESEEARQQALKLKDQHPVSWEEWTLVGNAVVEVQGKAIGNATPSGIGGLATLPSAYLPTAREFLGQLATAVARARLHDLQTVRVFSTFEDGIRTLLASDIQPVDKLGLMITSNVALSRHRWQAYSGVSTIAENPCHFATHSLLGVGTASLALETLTRFLEQIFDEAKIPARLRALRQVPRHEAPLSHVGSDEQFWKTDFLDRVPESNGSAPEADVPHITYFSGRDGFRSTLVSLSVPVEAITGCNTSSWTLQTITHEISHSVVRDVLGRLLPLGPNDVSELKRLCEVIDHPERAANLFEQVQVFLAFAILRLGSQSTSEGLTQRKLFERISLHLRDADEILTHVFDFMYHYEREPMKYVRSLWSTWSTIPNIEGRIRGYVVRTACALHATDLARDNGRDITLDTLRDCLTKQKAEALPDTEYVSQALEILTSERAGLEEELQRRVPLVKFARFLLYSPTVATPLVAQPEAIEDFYSGLQFADEPFIRSPLRLIEETTQEKGQPDAIRSLWMLQHLAYGMRK